MSVSVTNKQRKSRRVYDFDLGTLQQYFHMRQDKAAEALGVAPITLKRACARLQLRWPYRTFKSTARRQHKKFLKAARKTVAPTQPPTCPWSPVSAKRPERVDTTLAPMAETKKARVSDSHGLFKRPLSMQRPLFKMCEAVMTLSQLTQMTHAPHATPASIAFARLPFVEEAAHRTSQYPEQTYARRSEIQCHTR